MSALRLRALLLVAASASLAGGCALTSKSDPLAPRYFSPERPGDAPSAAPVRAGPAAELRLGRVEGSSNIVEAQVFRGSQYEIGYYRDRRWTEAPEQYLKRRLARVLFEERGLRQVVGGAGPTLQVELTAFEEVLAPKRTARVQVIARLHDQRLVLWEETLTVDEPVASGGDAADAAVAAIGRALRGAVDKVADRVVRELSRPLP